MLCWSSPEEIPHIQGKRNPSKMLGAETGQLQTTSQSDHMDHSLVKLNETKPCHVGPPKTNGSWWRGLTEWKRLEIIRDTNGTFHAKRGTIKARNGRDITEAKDIKKT